MGIFLTVLIAVAVVFITFGKQEEENQSLLSELDYVALVAVLATIGYWLIVDFNIRMLLLIGIAGVVFGSKIAYEAISRSRKLNKLRKVWEIVDSSAKSMGALVSYKGSLIYASLHGCTFEMFVSPERIGSVILRFSNWAKTKEDSPNFVEMQERIKDINERTHGNCGMFPYEEQGEKKYLFYTEDCVFVNHKTDTNLSEYFKSEFQYLHSLASSIVNEFPELNEGNSQTEERRSVGFAVND